MIRITAAKNTNKTTQKAGLLFVNDKKFTLIKSRKGVNILMNSQKLFAATFVGLAALVVTPSLVMATGGAPIGNFDGLHNNNCYFDGWTLDPDEPNKSIQIKVYRDGPASSGVLVGTFDANIASPDVTTVTGYPGNHRFVFILGQESGLKDGNPHPVYIYGVNSDGSGNDYLLTDTTQGTNTPRTAQCEAGEVVGDDEDGGVGGQDQDQDQGQDQNQTQNNNQETTVNVSNTNNNQNNVTINGVLGARPEVEEGEAPKESPKTGASAAATAVMLGGMPVGFWLRKFGSVAFNA